MTDVKKYKATLEVYVDSGRFDSLEYYLLTNSNLPGPRANLELAHVFSDLIEEKGPYPYLIEKIIKWTERDVLSASTGDPGEFLVFCSTVALGGLLLKSDEDFTKLILRHLRSAMNDSRWRVREAAAMAFQRIAERDSHFVLGFFGDLFPKANLLEKRAIIAALAHPPILDERDNCLFALQISERLLEEISNLTEVEKKSEGFKVLVKGMEYAISVFVAHLPDEGFEILARFASSDSRVITRIIKSNLSKTRLTKKYSAEVDRIKRILDSI